MKLKAELMKANARIAELEKRLCERPLTVRRMKYEIGQVIGQDLTGGNHSFSTTVSRDDLIKIHAFIMGLKK